MIRSIRNLLQGSLLLGAAALLAGGAAAQTITIQGSTVTMPSTGTATCTWTSMTVKPDGSIAVACGGTVTTKDTTHATFTISGPSTWTFGTGNPAFNVTRTNGPSGTVAFGYTVTGPGCGWVSQGPFFLNENDSQSLGVYPVATGQCVVQLVIQDGHYYGNTNGQFTLTVSSGSTPPPQNGSTVPTVSGCPTPSSTAYMATPLNWTQGTQTSDYTPLKMTSGDIAVYKIQDYHGTYSAARSSVVFTQGQASYSPPNPHTDITVSRCPGVIETNLADKCMISTDTLIFNTLTIFNRSWAGLANQDALRFYGCYAPMDQEDHYVNVRWTFQGTCSYGTRGCGFTMQWQDGAY